MDLPQIHTLPNLKVYHLEITNDNGKLIYNRKLKNGNILLFMVYESL